jgi:hypothetical protein
MKKTILVLGACLMLLAAQQSYAQAEFALGIKAGPNFASLNNESTFGENYKSRTGFHAGAFALIKLTKIGIQPELIFSQQGSKVEFNNQDLESNYSYLNIPIMVKLYLVAGLNLQVGPQFGFVTSAKQETFDDLGNKTKADIKDDLKGSDISAGLGAGWDLPFGLTIDARYNLGLSKINDSDGSPESKNQVFQISLGYKLIKLGK